MQARAFLGQFRKEWAADRINDVVAELRKDDSPGAARLAAEEKPPTEKSGG